MYLTCEFLAKENGVQVCCLMPVTSRGQHLYSEVVLRQKMNKSSVWFLDIHRRLGCGEQIQASRLS